MSNLAKLTEDTAPCSQPGCGKPGAWTLNADGSPLCTPCVRVMEEKIARIRREMRAEGAMRYAAARIGALDHGRIIRDMGRA